MSTFATYQPLTDAAPDSGTLILAVWFPLLVNGLAFAAVLLTRDTADRAPSTCHWVSTKGLFIGAPRWSIRKNMRLRNRRHLTFRRP
jgi:hypothetical protein